MNSAFNQRDARFVLFDLGREKTSWRGVALLAWVFVGSMLIAALLTPLLHWLVEYWHDKTGSANAAWMLGKGVDVYFDRLRMLAIVLGLPWLMSRCKLWSWRALGLAMDKSAVACTACWWIGGNVLIVGLAIARGVHSTLDATANATDAATLVESCASAFFAGAILGLLEEMIFRGMILRMFYTAMRQPIIALAAMAVFFAYTHFKVPTSVWASVPPGVHADTGFFVAYWTTFGITENFDLAQFSALFLLGMVLGLLTLRIGSLWPAIGLHAGIVTAMYFYRGSGLTEGWGAVVILAFLLIALVIIPAKDTSKQT